MSTSGEKIPEKNRLGYDCEIYDENGDKKSFIHLGHSKTRAHQMVIATQTTEITLQTLKLLPVLYLVYISFSKHYKYN